MKFRFAALSMSSMPMSTRMALRRASAPASPMEKSKAERRRYWWSGVMCGRFLLAGSSKTQDPSPREIPRPKIQNHDKASWLELAAWIFFGVWILELGSSSPFLLHRDDDGANHRGGEQQADDFEREHVVGHQFVADAFHGGLRVRDHVDGKLHLLTADFDNGGHTGERDSLGLQNR